MRVERILPPFLTVSFNDVSYSSGLVDRVTRAVRDHLCDVPILGFLTERKVRQKKVRPIDPIGLSDDSNLMDGLSEEIPSKDNKTDGFDWLGQQFVRRMIRPKKVPPKIIRPTDVIG